MAPHREDTHTRARAHMYMTAHARTGAQCTWAHARRAPGSAAGSATVRSSAAAYRGNRVAASAGPACHLAGVGHNCEPMHHSMGMISAFLGAWCDDDSGRRASATAAEEAHNGELAGCAATTIASDHRRAERRLGLHRAALPGCTLAPRHHQAAHRRILKYRRGECELLIDLRACFF